MPLYHNKKLVPFAKDLRNNMTNAERKLWYLFLNRLPLTVNRQKNIGNYIIDFYIHSHMLAIEIDGRQHKLPEHKMSDAHRDKELEALGITVLRYANRDINRNFRAVCEDILRHLELEASDLKQQTSEEDQ
jgi:very-short-patch-repair endonuclease